MANYYVKNGGDDRKDGQSDGNAWKTVGKVNAKNFANNDTIHLKRGSTFTDATLTLNSTSVGRSGITIRDYGTGDKPYINGDVVWPIKIDHALVDITLKDIDISGQDWLATKGGNIDLDNINGITLDGIYGNGWLNYGGVNKPKNAIEMDYCSGTIEVKNCKLYNWGPLNLPIANGEDYLAIHIKAHTSGSLSIHDNIVYNIQSDAVHRQFCTASANMYDNEFYNCGENAYDDKGSENINIYRNHCYRTVGFTGVGAQPSWNWALIHLHSQDGNASKNIKVYDNILEGNDNLAVDTQGEVGAVAENIEIYNNIINCKRAFSIRANTDNIKIHHNVVSGLLTDGHFYEENNAGTGIEVYNNSFYYNGSMSVAFKLNYSNADFHNNIIYINDSSLMLDLTVGNPTFAHNCWWNVAGTGIDWIDWKGTTYDGTEQSAWRTAGHPGALFTNPLFVNPSAGNFILQPTSPCIDKGINLGSPYNQGLNPASIWPNNIATLDQNDHGTGWDIGAFVHSTMEALAEGRIVGLTHPASVKHGALCDINASIENISTVSGVFEMQLFIDSVLKAKSSRFALEGGTTTTDRIEPFTAPSIGKSMAIMVKCIRIT